MALIKINNRSSEDNAIHGRRNHIFNGAMNVWQRNTSNGSVSANTYPAADRWKFWVGGAATSTARTEFTYGQTDVPNFRYYNRIVVGANSAAGDYSTFNQHIEDVTLFDNVTVTLSFYAKASTAWTVGIEPIQNFGSGGSPSSRVLGTPQTVSVGTSWERHTVTFTLASISGKTLGTTANTSNFELAFWLTGGSNFDSRTGSIGNQSGTFDVTGIQLEYGNKATPFEHRSYGEELQLCQRYYEHGDSVCRHPFQNQLNHIFNTPVFYKVRKRATPNVVQSNGYTTDGMASYGIEGHGGGGYDGKKDGFAVSTTTSTTANSISMVQFDWYAEAEL